MNQDALSIFWSSLPALSPIDGILTFQTTPDFLPEGFKELYIRQSYVDLFQIIMDNLTNSDQRNRYHRMAITGNPGIGKSLFLFYVMWRISSMDNVGTVILRRAKDDGLIYVFGRNNSWSTVNYGDIVSLLSSPNTWYLTDTLDPPPGEVKAVTILVASPARKHYKEFLKYSVTDVLRYLPVWSLEELMKARKSFSLSEEQVENRYCLIGGIPRFVLEKEQDLVSLIDGAIIRLNIDNFESIAVGNLQKDDEISHLVVHFEVNAGYTDATLRMGSSYITEKALDVFVNHQESKLKRFLLRAEHTSLLSTIRGNLFEAYAHRILSAGGEFTVRSISQETPPCTIKLKQLKTERFYDIGQCKDEKYFLPWNPNYPCIDSFIPHVGHFQMTVSLHHPVSKKMTDIVKDSGEKKIYFVVPQSIYSSFPCQQVASGGLNLDQFALLLNIE